MRRLSLTEIGEAYLEHVRRILIEVNEHRDYDVFRHVA